MIGYATMLDRPGGRPEMDPEGPWEWGCDMDPDVQAWLEYIEDLIPDDESLCDG